MRSLAAAISPGYFGFTNWAFAAEAPSEIAAQVPIATRKNNALIISFPPTFGHSRGCARRSRLNPSKPAAIASNEHVNLERRHCIRAVMAITKMRFLQLNWVGRH